MRFLADENMPGAAVTALATAGHDVAWVRRESPGIGDQDVLVWAVSDDRVLLTFDKDFGELARTARRSEKFGVVLFRLPMPKPGEAASVILDVINSRDDWAGHFSVVEPGRVRMRSLG